MAIAITPQDTSTLLGFYRLQAPKQTYFRDLTVTSVVVSDNEYIDTESLSEQRKLAPLVIPTAQGRPIYSEAAKMTRIKPAYVKPKDPVSPARALKRRPGEGLTLSTNQNPRSRFLAICGDILRVHRESIERRVEWLVAHAVIYGRVTLEGPDYPTTILDFGRDPANTVTLTGAGIVWTDVDAPILDQINDWIERIRQQDFGGPITRVTMGKDVVKHFKRNKQVLAQLNTLVRGTDGSFSTSIVAGEYTQQVAVIGQLEFWVTSDWYNAPEDGGVKEYMPRNAVLLTGPNLNVVEAYGAILDDTANFQPLAVFPKQWRSEDPAVTFIMTQSAPIAFPVNPNNSLLAYVI